MTLALLLASRIRLLFSGNVRFEQTGRERNGANSNIFEESRLSYVSNQYVLSTLHLLVLFPRQIWHKK
jgi:hypothetical protein